MDPGEYVKRSTGIKTQFSPSVCETKSHPWHCINWCGEAGL